MADASVQIMVAHVVMPDGTVAAYVERVRLGGGTQVVTVDGVPEERVHPTSDSHHVRLLSPDRMIPDQLLDATTYEDAVELGLKYATKRAEHAAQIDDLAASLKV
jgi:hypothetical protein